MRTKNIPPEPTFEFSLDPFTDIAPSVQPVRRCMSTSDHVAIHAMGRAFGKTNAAKRAIKALGEIYRPVLLLRGLDPGAR